MKKHPDSVMKVYQMQLLIQGAAFEWDKKNSWVERGRDGRTGTNATEVVSTATQALASPIALSTQSYLDREHIMYGLSVMDMKQGDRFPGSEA